MCNFVHCLRNDTARNCMQCTHDEIFGILCYILVNGCILQTQRTTLKVVGKTILTKAELFIYISDNIAIYYGKSK